MVEPEGLRPVLPERSYVTQARDIPDNPIDHPKADALYDLARGTAPYAVATMIILAALLYTGLGVELGDMFTMLVGGASAFLFGQALAKKP